MSSHAKAAATFLKDTKRVDWHDKALFAVREKRDIMSKQIPEWEDLRAAASAMKQHTLTHLDHYLELFEKNATANGMIVHWAKDAEEHNRIVYDIIKKHDGKKVVKSKSMLTEECELNPYLISKGLDVVETDLGERIMQFLKLPPSHIVLPAIGVKREEVADIFAKEIGSDKNNCDPTYLTHAARGHLRQKFIHADISMTGVNFAIADSGAFTVCTNEGNADMGTSFAKVHIASMGIEKVAPNFNALGVFTRLLARSGTGQPITTYTSLYRKPAPGKEIHVIIVDNGRSKILKDEHHRTMLKCLRCGACMNTCPVYRRSGGYSYSYFIPGPLGINLGMDHDNKKYSGNVSACTLCHSCADVCPAKVDLANEIYSWRQDLDKLGQADPLKKVIVKGMKFVMNNPSVFYGAIKMGGIFMPLIPRAVLYNKLNGWGYGREMPTIVKKTFNKRWKNGEIKKGANQTNNL